MPTTNNTPDSDFDEEGNRVVFRARLKDKVMKEKKCWDVENKELR